jgi:hypothetical protein
MSPTPAELQQALYKEVEAYCGTELHYILQPQYRTHTKALELYAALIALAIPVEHVKNDPQAINDTALDDALNRQKAVLDTLVKDYPDPKDQQALKEASAHLHAAVETIRTLRHDLPSTPRRQP